MAHHARLRYSCPSRSLTLCIGRNEVSSKFNLAIAALALTASSCAIHGQTSDHAAKPSHREAVQVDYAGVIGRSDVVFAQPNLRPDQAMPLGNGQLGVSVWSADGLTAQ